MDPAKQGAAAEAPGPRPTADAAAKAPRSSVEAPRPCAAAKVPRSSAAADTGTASFEAYFNAMNLGDPSSSRQGQQPPPQLKQSYATPISPIMPPPSQSVRPAGVHPLMQQHQMARMQQMRQQSYGAEAASSSSGGCFWPVGSDYSISPLAAAAPSPSSDYTPHLATNGRSSDYVRSRFGRDYAYPFAADGRSSDYGDLHEAAAAAAATSGQSVATKPRTLRASARQYQPIATALHYSVAPSPLMASSSAYQPSASNYKYKPLAAFSEQDYQENMMDFLRASHGGPSSSYANPNRRGRTLEEVRSELLRGSMPLGMVYFRESAAHVIRLLQEGVAEGIDQYRLSVLAGIKGNELKVMADKEGSQVFVALLRACKEQKQREELHAIVAAATLKPESEKDLSLKLVAKQENRDACVRELIRAAAPYPEMCKLITTCLACQSFLYDKFGERLLPVCFEEMSYEDFRILIRYATCVMGKMFMTASGSRCLGECFEKARGEDLEKLEFEILENAVEIATGDYSNYFMQRVLLCGSDRLKRGVVERLMLDVVSICQSRYGSYVVEACFLKTDSLELLHLVLFTFLNLPDEQIADLAQSSYGNYVVHKLLSTAKDHFPQETVLLARRIDRMPGLVLDQMHAKQVMRVVRKLLPRQRQY